MSIRPGCLSNKGLLSANIIQYSYHGDAPHQASLEHARLLPHLPCHIRSTDLTGSSWSNRPPHRRLRPARAHVIQVAREE
jgi:hypothetical protein